MKYVMKYVQTIYNDNSLSVIYTKAQYKKL